MIHLKYMYMSNYNFDKPFSSYSSTAESMQRFMASSMRLFSEYWVSYACAFDEFLNSNKHNYTDKYNWAHFNYYYYYDNWLKITDFESNKHLRSKRFLDSFQEYIESMVDLNASMKAIGY